MPTMMLTTTATKRRRPNHASTMIGYPLRQYQHTMGEKPMSNGRISSMLYFNYVDIDTASASQPIDGALSVDDLVSGTIIAFILAFTASFLQSRRNQNDFVLWNITPGAIGNNSTNTTTVTMSQESNEAIVFDEDSWKEMSRPENYVLFNTKLRDRTNSKRKNKPTSKNSSFSEFEQINQSEKNGSGSTERKIVLVALLLLFVPIFSVEFFFALSRQLICSNPFEQSDWAAMLCSPAYSSIGS